MHLYSILINGKSKGILQKRTSKTKHISVSLGGLRWKKYMQLLLERRNAKFISAVDRFYRRIYNVSKTGGEEQQFDTCWILHVMKRSFFFPKLQVRYLCPEERHLENFCNRSCRIQKKTNNNNTPLALLHLSITTKLLDFRAYSWPVA